MKKVFAAFLLAGLMGANQANAQFQALIDKGVDLLVTSYPPDVQSVKFTDTEEGLQVIAKVSSDSKKTDDETTEVYFLHSLDGGKTWEESIPLDTEDDKTWTGEMPAYDSGTEIQYAIWALDTSENVTTQLGCMVDGEAWPFTEDEDYLSHDCDGDMDDLEGCLMDITPYNCMFVMSKDDSPVDDDDDTAPPDFDILKMRVGYDEEYMYIDLAVEHKVSDGTANPMDLHAYLGLIHNPDKGDLPQSIDEYKAILNKATALVHAPLATLTSGLALPCSVVSVEGDEDPNQDEEALTCDAYKNHLFWRVLRKSQRENPSNVLKTLFVDGSLVTIDPEALKQDGSVRIYDNSHFTKVDMNGGGTYTYE